MTPFARFFLVMLIAAPLAYLGSAYYNGVDPIENLKELINPEPEPPQMVKETAEIEKELEVADTNQVVLKEKEGEDASQSLPSKVIINSQIAKLQDLLKFKNEKIDSLYLALAAQNIALEQKDSTIQLLRSQLDKIKGAIQNE